MTFSLLRSIRCKSRMEIILHVGAHKTATTYLQARLTRSVSSLTAKKVLFVPLLDLRKKIDCVRNDISSLNILFGVRDWRIAGVYHKFLMAAEVAGCNRLVISEENLLGNINRVVQTGILYPSLKKRLTPVFKGLNGNPVTVLLSVRSYDSLLAGMWSQIIRKMGYCKMDEQLKARLLSESRGWVDVIDEIIHILPPGSQLRVWRYEDFSKLENEIVALFVGETNLNSVETVNHTFLPSLSTGAIEHLDNLHAQGMPTGPTDVKRVANNFSRNNGFKPYLPWTNEEKAFLVTKYEQDIASIRERWPELMISTPSEV
jgi:hypothetical protein